MHFIIEGLLTGGILSLASIGFTFFWGISGIINLAQGAFLLLGSYATWWLTDELGLPWFAACIFTAAFAFFIGYSIQRLLVSKVVTSPSYPSLLLTFGIGLGITSVLDLLFSSNYLLIPVSAGTARIVVDGLSIPLLGLTASAIGLVSIFSVTALLNNSRHGIVFKAIANSKRIAQLSGLPVQHYIGIAAGIATTLAAVSGVFLGSIQAFSSTQADQLTLLISVSAVVGKLGSLWGAFFTSLLIGIAGGIVSQYFSQNLLDVFALVILVIALSIRSRATIADFIRPRVANGPSLEQ